MLPILIILAAIAGCVLIVISIGLFLLRCAVRIVAGLLTIIALLWACLWLGTGSTNAFAAMMDAGTYAFAFIAIDTLITLMASQPGKTW